MFDYVCSAYTRHYILSGDIATEGDFRLSLNFSLTLKLSLNRRQVCCFKPFAGIIHKQRYLSEITSSYPIKYISS